MVKIAQSSANQNSKKKQNIRLRLRFDYRTSSERPYGEQEAGIFSRLMVYQFEVEYEMKIRVGYEQSLLNQEEIENRIKY